MTWKSVLFEKYYSHILSGMVGGHFGVLVYSVSDSEELYKGDNLVISLQV